MFDPLQSAHIDGKDDNMQNIGPQITPEVYEDEYGQRQYPMHHHHNHQQDQLPLLTPMPQQIYNNGGGRSSTLDTGENNSKFLDKLEIVIQKLVRGIGPLFVFFAVVLIGSIAFIHFTALLPYIKEKYNRKMREAAQRGDTTSTHFWEFISVVFHYTFSIFLLFNLSFNYVLTIITPPGSPPRDEDYSQQELHIFKSITTLKKSDTWSKFCVNCRLPKIERTHHCSLCKNCILRMDHHCPWVNNCVGLNNHRYFILFLIYLWISCIYVCILSAPHVFYTLNMVPFSMLMAFVLTLTISVALGGLLFWQLYLILSNQTTIEFLHNRTQSRRAKARGEVYKNPYDQGLKKNFYEFFRVNRWYLFAIPMLSNHSNEKKFETISSSTILTNSNKYEDSV